MLGFVFLLLLLLCISPFGITAFPIRSAMPPVGPSSAPPLPVSTTTRAPTTPQEPISAHPTPAIATVEEALSDSPHSYLHLLVYGTQRRAYDPVSTEGLLVHPPYTFFQGDMDHTLVRPLLRGQERGQAGTPTTTDAGKVVMGDR